MNTTITTLQSSKFTLGSNYLDINGELSNDEWKAAYNELSRFNEVTNWWLGDLLNAIEAKGKDILSTIGDEVGLDYRTLDNVKSLCRQIPKDKRVEGVSYTHHREAWSITKNHQWMKEELMLAKANNLSVQDLRYNIREKKQDHSKTIIPEVQRSRDDVAHTEALNAIVSIKRYINNNHAKVSTQQQALFKSDWSELVSLVQASIG